MKDGRYTPPRVIVTFTLEAGDQGDYVTDDLRNWVYNRFQVLPERLIGHFSEWDVDIGPGNVTIKIEDRRPWWKRVLLGPEMEI